jgi:Fe-S cluster assembly protein SufB
MDENTLIENFTNSDYKYGFESKIDVDKLPKGINESIVKLISKKKKEPL